MIKYINMDSRPYFAFNIWSLETAKAVIDAASSMKVNVILQTSSNIFDAFSYAEKIALRDFVKQYSDLMNIKAYLHLDHCRNTDIIKCAVECSWDSVMLDFSHLNIDENIKTTNQVCKLAHKSGILVEAEIGQINGVEDNIASQTEKAEDIETILYFNDNVDVDMLAAAIGTAHGIYKKAPVINYALLDSIQERLTSTPFVIHGGSGLSDETFLRILSYKNVKKINISSEIKIAYRKGILNSINDKMLDDGIYTPLSVTRKIEESIYHTVIKKLGLLNTDFKEGYKNECCDRT